MGKVAGVRISWPLIRRGIVMVSVIFVVGGRFEGYV